MASLRTVTAALLLTVFGWSAAWADASDEYTQDEILRAATGFFADTSRNLADVVAKAFEDHGRPNAYITGEEASGAIGIGLRYGNGTLTRKKFDLQKIYWQGPSIGFDLGGDASKVFVLIYRLKNRDELYQRIPGVDGSAYLVGGVGMSYLQSGNVILAPIQTGVGLRLGINVGYLHFGPEHTWNPF
jgi:hypothetical protein